MIPLSFAQARLWFLNQVEGPSPTYNVPLTVRLRGPLDREALRAAVTDLTDRHEALRTVYVERDGSPWQQVLDGPSVVWSVAEYTPEAVRTAAGHGFDLAAELPLRAHLFEAGPTDHTLLLVLHHIAADGWSLDPLVRDLATAYRARTAAGRHRSGSRCRCSTPTTRSGSRSCSARPTTRRACSPSNSPTGAPRWPSCRRS
ncbi:condensation domain-containing protein [Kitasatospora gansuensis]